jgi:hypothetical protein
MQGGRGTLVGCKGPAVHAPAVHARFNGSGLLASRRRDCTWQQLPPSAALPAVQRPTAVLLPDRHVAHPESSGKYCSKLLQAVSSAESSTSSSQRGLSLLLTCPESACALRRKP